MTELCHHSTQLLDCESGFLEGYRGDGQETLRVLVRRCRERIVRQPAELEPHRRLRPIDHRWRHRDGVDIDVRGIHDFDVGVQVVDPERQCGVEDVSVEMDTDDALRIGGDLYAIATVVTVEIEDRRREEVSMGVDGHRRHHESTGRSEARSIRCILNMLAAWQSAPAERVTRLICFHGTMTARRGPCRN